MRIICLEKGKAKKNKQKKKKDGEKKLSYIVAKSCWNKKQENEWNECPFYTVSNAFISAIVCRHSLNSIYLKLIIYILLERKERREIEKERVKERTKERMYEYVCARAGGRACVYARRKCVEGRSRLTSAERIKIYRWENAGRFD